MPKGPRCTVCNHTEANLIDAAILGGHMSLNRIAHRFGVSYHSLVRHRANGHVAGKGVELPADMPTSDDKDYSTQTMRKEARNILRSLDPETLSTNALIGRANALRLMLDSIDKAEPPSRETTTMDDVVGLPEFFEQVLFRTLEPFPEVKEAVLAAMSPDLFTDKERHDAYIAANRVH